MQNNCEIWAVDSGASFHMTAKRHLFVEYNPYQVKRAIITADVNSQLAIIGSGTVRLQLTVGGFTQYVGLKNVLHVENLSTNLLSLRELLKQYDLHSSPEYFAFMDKNDKTISFTAMFDANSQLYVLKTCL